MQAPKMYLFAVLTVSLTALAHTQAKAEACSPSYNIVQKACLPIDQVLGPDDGQATDSPVQELVPEDECPVTDIIEVNGCYSNSKVEISPKAIQGCLEIRPSTVREWWLKSRCLMDAYQAQNEQRDVSAAVVLNQRIENALRAIRNSQKMNDPNLSQLRVEINQVLPGN